MALTLEEIKERQRKAGRDHWKNKDSVSRSQEMARVASYRHKGKTKKQLSEEMRALRAKREEKKLLTGVE